MMNQLLFMQEGYHTVKQKEIDWQIEVLLEKDYIEKLNSQYAAQTVPVRKKDGSLRMCVNQRGINSKTVKCNYPVSRLEDLFNKVKGCKVFSLLDLKKGYYHVPLKLKDRNKIDFVVAATESFNGSGCLLVQMVHRFLWQQQCLQFQATVKNFAESTMLIA